MPGDIVRQRGHTALVLTHQLIATILEQQGGFQSKHSQATMYRLPRVPGSSQLKVKQPNRQQSATDHGSCCEASQQVR